MMAGQPDTLGRSSYADICLSDPQFAARMGVGGNMSGNGHQIVQKIVPV